MNSDFIFWWFLFICNNHFQINKNHQKIKSEFIHFLCNLNKKCFQNQLNLDGRKIKPSFIIYKRLLKINNKYKKHLKKWDANNPPFKNWYDFCKYYNWLWFLQKGRNSSSRNSNSKLIFFETSRNQLFRCRSLRMAIIGRLIATNASKQEAKFAMINLIICFS